MNDIIIKDYKIPNVQKGFIPESNQKIFVECDECKKLHEIKLGQYFITNDNKCDNCGCDFGDLSTMELFEYQNCYFAYSDKKYIEGFVISSDYDRRLPIALSSVIGEAFIEDEWDLHDGDCVSLHAYLQHSAEKNFILINKNDIGILLYLKCNNTLLDRVYIIDDNYSVSKLNKIEVEVKIN